jgi:hypothetical protein
MASPLFRRFAPPGVRPEPRRDFATELMLCALPPSARPVYLEAYQKARHLMGAPPRPELRAQPISHVPWPFDRRSCHAIQR